LRLLVLKIKLLFIRLVKIKIILPKLRLSAWTALVAIFLILGTVWIIIIKDLPSPNDLVERKQQVSTKIFDRNGVLLYNIYKDENRSIVSLKDIPLHVQLATLAIEDAEFYSHIGFSVRGITRAFFKNAANGSLSGGSTITQQLVKNALLSPEKTITRKIKELVLAVAVEIKFSKEEILEMYLNEVSYGGTAYGIQEASRVYFDKDVNQIDLAEATLLAGLPKSPTNYSPFGPNPSSAIERQKEVLRLMEVNKYISPELAQKTQDQPLKFAENKTEIKAPHFVMYVRQILEDTYGKELVEKGGLEVTTTLDYNIQSLAESVVTTEIDKLAGLNVSNGAVIVLSPKTGEILAMVGSTNYFDVESDGNVNVTTSLRQPGSSIKVVNYANALDSGYTAATPIDDTPISYRVPGQPIYTPRNYDGKYRGRITLRSALAESRNIPAVKILANFGVSKMLELGEKMGITTWQDPSQYGLSLTLGGGEVKLIDLAQVYATLANYGKKSDLAAIHIISNSNGTLKTFECEEAKVAFMNQFIEAQAQEQVPASKDCAGEQVLDERVAFVLTDVLRDNLSRSPAFGSFSQLVIPGHSEVAVKTGTSNNLRDNLTVGYTQDYVVAVWVGNNDNSPMSRVASGVTGASVIFNKIMTGLLADKENHDWEVPEGLVQLPICTLTGTLACNGCPTKMEWFKKEDAPTKHCSSETIRNILEKKKEGTVPTPQLLPEAASI